MFALAFLVAAADPTALELVRRYDAVMSPPNFEAESRMTAHREDGTERTYKMRVLKSGRDKLRALFLEPPTAKGQEMLRNGENLWLYMPNLKRAVRVASRDQFMGGDFNNADVMRVNYEADYEPTLMDTPDGPVLRLKAKLPTAACDEIRLWMTKDKNPQPLRAEFYAQSAKLLRSAEFMDVKDFGKGLVRPSRMRMRNELQKERWSEMVWDRIELKEDIPAQRFVVDDLGR
jgi:outer membrane lipoprotein-sorting protein